MDEFIEIVANEETKDRVNRIIAKMSLLVRERLSKTSNPGIKLVITPYYIQIYDGDDEVWSMERPNSLEKIVLRLLLWFENIDFFESRKEALDWLYLLEFNQALIDWIGPHILEFVNG